MSEIVYLLTNPTMPGLVKIGMTTDLQSRLQQLSSHSGVPVAFECFYACEVKSATAVEKALHDAFGDHRINVRREFFRLNPARVHAVLQLLSTKDIVLGEDPTATEDEKDALKREKERRERFRFPAVGISPGSTLRFLRDETITASVINDTQIEFEGSITSLTNAARTILNRMGFQWSAVQGPNFWMFGDETLTEIRMRLESGE
jgi:hypothetical protein